VKVKLGPVIAQYEGKASFAEKDDAAKRGVLRAEGRETKGQGSANATVTASLTPVAEGTRVTVETDLAIVGRLAQMGRGLIAEVSGKLLGDFVANLEREIAAGSAPERAVPAAAAAAATSAAAAPIAPAASDSLRAQETAAPAPASGVQGASSAPAPAPAREAAPVDLLATAGVPVLKRLVPLAIGIALGVAALIWLL
jgi:hypothetical protein